MASRRDSFRSSVDPGDSDNFYEDEDAMEEEMDNLNISVSSPSILPFSTLEKPLHPIRATSCTNIIQKSTSENTATVQNGKSRASLINIHSAATTLFTSATDVTIIPNNNGKRERNTSSNDSLEKNKKNLRFSTSNESDKTNSNLVSLQNNANESEGTQTLDKDFEKYTVNRAAAPMWTSARRHRLAEAKANMRALHFERLLEQDTIPSPFLGIDKLPRYLLNDNGTLSDEMTTMIKDQAIARTKLAIEELRETERNDSRRSKYYNGICEQLYAQEKDDNYPKAASLQTSLVTHFKQIEAKRLQALFNKELERKPTDDKAFADLLCRHQDEVAGSKPGKSSNKRPSPSSSNRDDNAAKSAKPSEQPQRQPNQAIRQAPNPQQARKPQDNYSRGRGNARGRGKPRDQSSSSRDRYQGRGNSRQRSGERHTSPPQSPNDPIDRSSLSRQQKDILDVLRGLLGQK